MTDQHSNEQGQSQPEKKRPRKPKGRANGEGSVFKRSGANRSKPWVAQITKENGKKEIIGYFKTEAEGIAARNKALRDLEQGAWVSNSKITMAEYLNYWLEHVHRASLKETTYGNYKDALSIRIIPTLGYIQVQKLTVRHLQMFYSDLQTKDKLSPARVHYINAILHGALSHAVKEGLVAKNICKDVKLPRLEKSERRVLTLKEASQLLETATNETMKMLLTLAITTGMRKGEMLALKWQDIDWIERQIHIRRNQVRLRGRGLVEMEPKTVHSRRTITLPSFVLDLLRAYKGSQQEVRKEAGASWQDKDLIFCNAHGNYIPPTTLRFWFIKLLKAANLPYMRIHDLRHSAVTLLLAMGVPPNVVQEIVGHSHINITLGMYAHVMPGMQSEAMSRWDATLGDVQASARREALRKQWQSYSPQSQDLLETLLNLYGEHAARLALDVIQEL